MKINLLKSMTFGIVLTFLCGGLCGCGGSATAGASSPQAVSGQASISSRSDLTESSQVVDMRIGFDRTLKVADGATDDFDITLDGSALNTKAMQVSCTADGKDLHVLLTPTDAASGNDPSVYFASYQGSLVIKAKDSNGTLGHVTGTDGVAAVMKQAYTYTIPSGVKIETIRETKATETKNASTTVKVTQSAQIRCCTWFDIGGTRLYMHNHEFMRESNATCASAMAQAITSASSGAYMATAKGTEVTVTAKQGKTGKAFDVKIIEGVS